MRRIWLCFLVTGVTALAVSAQTPDANCSDRATKLLQEAGTAQPMNVRGNNGNVAKAESLYKQAISDSPKCRRASRRLVVLLLRSERYEEANHYNEEFLKQFPDDPAGLSDKADLVSRLKKDYPVALEIEMKLLSVSDFNKNGNVFYKIARIYSLMNRLDDSINYLRQALAIDKGWGDKANAQTDSDFENLRRDKRFWMMVKN
jgi:tetratricopeptide (TPR) repeat protein